MEIKGLIARGSAYLDINVINITERQVIINEWFNDCLTCVHGIFGDSNFYATFKERWINIFGFESKPVYGDDMYEDANMNLGDELNIKVSDCKHRILALIKELERLAT